MCFLPFGTCLCPWKYTRAEVDKDAHGSYLIAKAWNSRVLLEWLNDAALAAATRDLPQAAETCFEVNDFLVSAEVRKDFLVASRTNKIVAPARV